MPEITLVGDDGGYVARVVPPPPPPPPAAASNTNTTNAPPPPGRDLTALRQWGQPSPSTSSHPPLAANANFAEKELIQDLKQERLMLLRKVQESEEEKREVEGRLRATVGEVAIVRGRLHKVRFSSLLLSFLPFLLFFPSFPSFPLPSLRSLPSLPSLLPPPSSSPRARAR